MNDIRIKYKNNVKNKILYYSLNVQVRMQLTILLNDVISITNSESALIIIKSYNPKYLIII